MTVPITSKVDSVVTFIYKVDDNPIADYKPKQKLHDGENILSLLYPISGLGANSAKRLEVYMTADGGKMSIASANGKAAVAGSGIASGYTEWDGKILVEEYVDVYKMGDNSVKLIKPSESLNVSTMKKTIHGFTVTEDWKHHRSEPCILIIRVLVLGCFNTQGPLQPISEDIAV